MKQFNMKTSISIGVVALIVLGIFVFNKPSVDPVTPLGSLSNTPYKATTTDATWGSVSTKVLKTGSGYIGSVVITGATAAAGLNFYDATTTRSHADHATTSIAVINASSPAGTYTVDVAFTRGLVVEYPSAIGVASSTITWR